MEGKRRFFNSAMLMAMAIAIACSGSVIYGLLQNSAKIGSKGTVKSIGVEVYSDSACINKVSSMDWGMAEPGSVKDTTVYVKNTGNAPVTLSLGTDKWNPPAASSYMRLTWDYGGGSIGPSSNVQVKLTLTLFANVTGVTSFSFDIIVTGSG